MPFGVSLKCLRIRSTSFVVGQAVRQRAVRVDPDVERVGIADGVGELHLALRGQAGGDDVLGDVAGHVRRRAIHLGRVLAAEGAAAVPAAAAVGVHDDLAAGQAAVAVRAAVEEAAGRVDVAARCRPSPSFGAGLPGDIITSSPLIRSGRSRLQRRAGSACR